MSDAEMLLWGMVIYVTPSILATLLCAWVLAKWKP